MSKGFIKYHPILELIYFTAAILLPFISMHPVILIEGLLIASVNLLSNKKWENIKYTIYIVLFFFIFSVLINPLFVNKGQCVLFKIMDKPVFLEPIVYGVSIFIIMLTITLIFVYLNQILSISRMLSLISNKFTNLSLIISMTLTQIPILHKRYHMIKEGCKNLYRIKTKKDKVQLFVKTIGCLINWTLESAIITSDMMNAKGFGIKKRTSHLKVRFNAKNIMLAVAMIVLISITITGMISNDLKVAIYPNLSYPKISAVTITTMISYGLFLFTPILINIKEIFKI